MRKTARTGRVDSVSIGKLFERRILPLILICMERMFLFMLKLKLDPSSQAFRPQLEALSSLVPVTLAEDGILLSCSQGNDGMTVCRKGETASITYQKTCEFFRGILVLMERCGETEFCLHEKAGFAFNGEMIDNSRNAVLTLETAKRMIQYSALMGLDNILLYNEETYEIPEDPYFGYLRMRYSLADIRELTDFAKEYGVTIIPCIQTLAHLAQTLRWAHHADIKDTDDILLCDEEKTYALIEQMIKAWRSCVDTDIIHIGMDEAHALGLGNYLTRHGFVSRFEIMCRHLGRVVDICKKYQFKPMMWSDMFFRICFGGDYYSDSEIDPELLALVPKDVMLIYWDYYSTDRPGYERNFENHLKFQNEIGFAGGAWKWSGWVPSMRHSHNCTKIALEVAREKGIQTVFTTAWGDDGAEGSIYNILPNLLLFAEISYCGGDIDASVSRKLEVLTSYTLEEYFALSEPNETPTHNQVPHVNPSKYLFYQDLLMGIFDYHVREDYPAFFKGCADKLAALSKRDSKVNYLFDTLSKLCHALELKCNMGVRLKAAYDAGNRDELARIANEEIPELCSRVEAFYRAFRHQWMVENRTGGFDVQDLRLGGMLRRMESCREIILAYLSGELGRIRELEEERLPYDSRRLSEDLNVDCNGWRYIVSPNVISHA